MHWAPTCRSRRAPPISSTGPARETGPDDDQVNEPYAQHFFVTVRVPPEATLCDRQPEIGEALNQYMGFCVRPESQSAESVCKKVCSCGRVRTPTGVRYRDLTAAGYKLTASCAGGRAGYSPGQPAAPPCASAHRQAPLRIQISCLQPEWLSPKRRVALCSRGLRGLRQVRRDR